MNTNYPASQASTKDADLSTIDQHLNALFASFKHAHDGRKRTLTLTEVLHFIYLKQRYTCHTYLGLHACLSNQGYTLPHYSNFLKTIKLTICFLLFLIKQVVTLNRHIFLNQECKLVFVDSTCLPVCHIKRSGRHKTMRDYACYSKSTMGEYYGMKLHIICDYHTKDVIDYDFTVANVDDRKYLANAMKTQLSSSTPKPDSLLTKGIKLNGYKL